ncbi:FAD/NAD(P)-binding domain-containing protein, partial [Eremomyces bilateralis CBS 781.70]
TGWAGYTLARQLDAKIYRPIVISPRSYFVFTPLLASTSVGTLEFRTALEPVRSRRTSVEFVQGWADDVDFTNKTIMVEEAVDDPRQGLSLTGDAKAEQEAYPHRIPNPTFKGKTFQMKWDKLIIAVGCYSQTFGTPGVREHALFLKDVGDARRIRKKLLTCFETASLPTTSEEVRRHLLNFAIVGGGPTGIEFAAELHDVVKEDLAKVYPDLVKYCNITVYDVAPSVLPMFDEELSSYAMKTFRREGIKIKTSHHVENLRLGPPNQPKSLDTAAQRQCLTLKVEEEGELGVGMVVWSTGLMMNPFISKALDRTFDLPETTHGEARPGPDTGHERLWKIKKQSKSGSIITDDRLRVLVQSKTDDAKSTVLQDVYAIGDCATTEGTSYPATAQVASQKAYWLAKRLNRGGFERGGFNWKNAGTLAYIGSWRAIMQAGTGGHVSGRAAWIVWRGAYLTKSVSWRNKLLIPMYWVINWAFGRDITRF